jgi:outer membrane autotransporter protein
MGARVGTSFNAGNLALQPFVSASVWHEFAGNVTTSFSGSDQFGIGLTTSSELTSTRVGTFGQYGVGVTGQVLNTGWLGYARLDYRKGDNIEGTSVNGGVRYQFTPESRGAVSARF